MAISSIFAIPEEITVHLGVPSDNGVQNVRVPFAYYIKNVASSEIYPTWPESAIRANIYAQISFAMNRIVTEHYRANGYDFDITNSTQYDQSFVYGRDVFENISQIVDEIFNSYVVRSGDAIPLFARYCNGTTSTCPGGLSQWGSVSLAKEGFTPYRILNSYYGDVSIIDNAPVANVTESYPGAALRVGSYGDDVKRVQISLNRISKNYSAIPKIAYPDGVFDEPTEAAVKEFQRIFNLTPDGVVGRATWYKIISVVVGIKRLSELDSEALPMSLLNNQFITELKVGSRGDGVTLLQYYLAFIAEFNDFIPLINADGVFGADTQRAVEAFQQSVGLPITGVVDEITWNALYSSFITKYDALPQELKTSQSAPYPGEILAEGDSGEMVSTLQKYLSFISRTYPSIPAPEVSGYFDAATERAVIAYQNEFGLPPRGVVNYNTWTSIAELYRDLYEGEKKDFGQNPGYNIDRD